MLNDIEARSTAASIVLFLLFGAPFVLYPQLYAAFKLIKKIKAEWSTRKNFTKRIFLCFLGIVLLVIGTAIFFAFMFMDNPPFFLRLLFYIFILPIFMVSLSIVAGLGKAFEAGFSSATLLKSLDSMRKESKKPNHKMKADEK